MRDRSLSESRIRTPKPATISAEMALMTGIGAAAGHGVDHHGQRLRIDAGHQAGDDVIVEGDGEGEQCGGDDAGQQGGQRHVAEGLPLVGAEVHGGFFERRVEGAQARRDDDHHVGDREGDVRQDHGVHAELPVEDSGRPTGKAPAARCR